MATMTIEGFLKSEWTSFKNQDFSLSEISAVERSHLIFNAIVSFFEEKDLDVHNDRHLQKYIDEETTAKSFHQLKNHIQSLIALRRFNEGYYNEQQMVPVAITRYAYLDYGVERLLPALKNSIEQYGLPSEMNIFHRQSLKHLFSLYEDGTLKTELQKTAIIAAKEYIKLALTDFEKTRENEEPNRTLLNNAIQNVRNTIQAIHQSDEYYSSAKLEVRTNSVFEEPPVLKSFEFNVFNVQEFFKELIFIRMQNDFLEIKKWQDNGQFIIDRSGNGSKLFFLPMQEMLELMQEAKIDTNDPKAYQRIGTTKEEFRQRFKIEKQCATSDASAKSLLNLKLNFQ